MRGTGHAFAGNPVIPGKRNKLRTEDLVELLENGDMQGARVLPVADGRTLVAASRSPKGAFIWRLAWQAMEDFGTRVPVSLSSGDDTVGPVHRDGEQFAESGRKYDKLVYLGEKGGVAYFSVEVPLPPSTGSEGRRAGSEQLKKLAAMFAAPSPDERVAFVDLRTLMVATDFDSEDAMADLSISGHARAMLEWHKQAVYCGRCGSKAYAILAGQRRQCSNVKCNNKLYPRIDPVVIMLVIDKERDRVVLGRQERFVPRMWSCLAGFSEPGESLVEAVRRETREEVGIEVGDVVHHSSQPWPVGPSSMPCQLMIGFFAFAKTFDISIDNKELQDAQWHSRDQVRNALTYNEYDRTQQEASMKIYQACFGEESAEWVRDRVPEPNQENKETNQMVAPGAYAIAHHLIADWVNQGSENIISKV